MKVFITGGAGLIGQAIAKRHIVEGDEVFLFDNRYNAFNDYSNLLGLDIYGEGQCLEDALDWIKPDIISHQAASVGVGESQYRISLYHDNNVSFTAKLLQAILDLKLRPQKIMLAGSMGPYGEGKRQCVSCERVFTPSVPRQEIDISCPFCYSPTVRLVMVESQILSPQSQYAVTKMTQEYMIRVFCNTYDIPGVSLRYFSVYGTECNPLNPYTGVLSIVSNKLLNCDGVVLNEDGLQTRDLIHADDVALAHFMACNSVTDNWIALNIGTGKSHSMQYVAEEVRRKLRIKKDITYNGKVRRGDIRDACADIFGARAVIGWKPAISLDDGISKYCHYVKNNKEKFIVKDTCKEADAQLIARGLL